MPSYRVLFCIFGILGALKLQASQQCIICWEEADPNCPHPSLFVLDSFHQERVENSEHNDCHIHLDCLEKWAARGNCPCCRRQLSKATILFERTLQGMRIKNQTLSAKNREYFYPVPGKRAKHVFFIAVHTKKPPGYRQIVGYDLYKQIDAPSSGDIPDIKSPLSSQGFKVLSAYPKKSYWYGISFETSVVDAEGKIFAALTSNLLGTAHYGYIDILGNGSNRTLIFSNEIEMNLLQTLCSWRKSRKYKLSLLHGSPMPKVSNRIRRSKVKLKQIQYPRICSDGDIHPTENMIELKKVEGSAETDLYKLTLENPVSPLEGFFVAIVFIKRKLLVD